MKKIILILFAVVIASANILAQAPQGNKPRKSPEERAENMTKRMTKELALNADQQAKVKAIILKRIQDRDAKMKEAKAEREKTDNDLKLILTAEQYQTYQQKKEEIKQKRKERRMAPPAPDNNNAPQPK